MSGGRIQKASIAGSLITAFFASICCIGPVIFAILGISGAAFVQKFEDYRPLFAALAAVFLGVSFYFTYRKKPAEQCEPGSYCAHPRSDKINKMILWTATVFVALFLLFPQIISKWVG